MANLIDQRFADDVETALSVSGAQPGWLELEVTENAVMADPRRTVEVLDRVRGMGVTVALDDFGTGQSSLAWLRRLPADVLKIDKSFVFATAGDQASAAIVRAIVGMGHALGMRVVAEGIEDDDAWKRLEALGCDVIQGYALSRPLPAAELDAWLRAGAVTARTSVQGWDPCPSSPWSSSAPHAASASSTSTRAS
jgi:diguanylate cyclase